MIRSDPAVRCVIKMLAVIREYRVEDLVGSNYGPCGIGLPLRSEVRKWLRLPVVGWLTTSWC